MHMFQHMLNVAINATMFYFKCGVCCSIRKINTQVFTIVKHPLPPNLVVLRLILLNMPLVQVY